MYVAHSSSCACHLVASSLMSRKLCSPYVWSSCRQMRTSINLTYHRVYNVLREVSPLPVVLRRSCLAHSHRGSYRVWQASANSVPYVSHPSLNPDAPDLTERLCSPKVSVLIEEAKRRKRKTLSPDDVSFVDPNFAQGNLFTMSVVESLLVSVLASQMTSIFLSSCVSGNILCFCLCGKAYPLSDCLCNSCRRETWITIAPHPLVDPLRAFPQSVCNRY